MDVRTAAAVALALALTLATGCGGANNGGSERAQPAQCRSDGTSTLCLHPGTAGFGVTGTGFAPGSDVHVDVATGAGQLVPVAPDGTFPAPGRAVGFLPGLDEESHRLEGVDRAGRPVAYVLTCAVGGDRQPRCAF